MPGFKGKRIIIPKFEKQNIPGRHGLGSHSSLSLTEAGKDDSTPIEGYRASPGFFIEQQTPLKIHLMNSFALESTEGRIEIINKLEGGIR